MHFNSNQCLFLCLGAGLIVVLVLVVPWTDCLHTGSTHIEYPLGYAPFVDPPKSKWPDYGTVKVDWTRVFVTMAVTVLATVVAFVLAGQWGVAEKPAAAEAPPAPLPRPNRLQNGLVMLHVKEEREACAAIAERYGCGEVAAEIRARSKQASG